MPHITINCYKGRSDETKREIAKKIKEAAIDAMGCDPTRVSVSIRDFEKSRWKSIYEKEILNDPEHLIISPGYTYESLDE